jgi:uncharacterized coiled-coil protein SlyX
MAILTKNQLSASNASSFPDNTAGLITPQILRNFNTSIIDTLVDSLNTGSYAITTGSNDFTQANSFTSISASSFVSASQFVGDGSKLTNITASIALPILDEGILQGYATSMNFTGSAISAQVIAGTAVVQVNIDNVGLVTTASFNAYTSSTNTSITNLNASSASQQVSINALNQSSASQQVSINALNVYTASQDSSSIVNSITELNTFSASAKIELVNLNTSVTNLNSFSSSTNSSITQLNSSTASQQISINTLNTFSASALVSISNLNSTTASLNTSASLALVTASFDTGTRNLTFTKGNTTQFSVNIPDVSGSTINTGSFATTGSNTFTGTQIITAGNSLQTNRIIDNGTDITIDGGMNGVIITSAGGKKTIISTPTEITGAVNITGSLTASLQNGYAWVGNGSGITIAVPTSSIAGASINTGSFVTTSSFNDYTASQSTASLVTSINNLNTFTQSAQVSINALNSATSSYVTESETGSFATTGSNTFVGNQTITGNITAFSASFTYLQTIYESSSVIYSSGSNIFGDELSDTQTLSGSVKVQGSLTVNGTPVQTSSVDISALNSFTSSQLTINSAIQASTSSLNTFSASTLTRLTNIESTTASLNSSVTALNTFTASQSTASLVTSINELNSFTSSQLTINSAIGASTSSLNSATASLFTSASLALVTASFDTGTRNLTFTKGNTTQFSVNIPDVSGSTLPSGVISGSAQITSLGFVSSSVTASSLVTASVNLNTITFTKGDGTTFPITVNTGSGGGGTTNTGSLLVTASAFINTITFTKGDGTTFPVTVTTGSLNYVTGSFGAFYDTTTQSGSAGVAYSMKLNNTDISDGVIISGSGGIKVLAAGTYDLQFSAQVLADTGSDTVWIWLKKNGTNVPDTSTKLVLRNNEADVAAWNFVVAANANDVFELAWQSNGGHTKLFAEAAASNYTAIPSVIATMNRVDVGGGTNLVSTASFNTYTSSNDQKVNSLINATGSYATTGSNSFNGNQNITGSLFVSGANGISVDIGYDIVNTGLGVSFNGNSVSSFISAYNPSFSQINLGVNDVDFNYYNDYVIVASSSSIQFKEANQDATDFNYRTWMQVDATIGTAIKPIQLLRNTNITGSLNVSGSSTFRGNQTISGSLTISSSATIDLSITGTAVITTEDKLARLIMSPNSFNLDASKTISTGGEGYIFGPTGSDASFYLGVYDQPNFTTDVELKLKADSNGLSFNDWDNGTAFDYIPFMTLTPNVGDNPLPVMTRGLVVTGSVSITETMKLKPLNPLPAGTIGDLAVSGSHLYFYNGAWTQLD